MSSTLKISTAVLEKLAALGANTDPKSIATMVKFSMPFTHPKGNVRYGDLVFEVVDDAVLSVHSLVEKRAPVVVQDAVLQAEYPVEPEYEDYEEIPPQILGKLPDGRYEIVCPLCHDDGDVCQPCNTTGVLKLRAAEFPDYHLKSPLPSKGN